MKNKPRIKVELSADISESANEIIKNTLSYPTQSVGDTVGTLINFFNNSVLYPLKKYNIYAEKKLEKYAEELKKKASKIPEEKRVHSSINILGSTMDGLKYNLDEEHIKNMFINILTSDMNSDKKNKVLPSFVEIVKQLSNDDAKFLKEVYSLFIEDKNKSFAVTNIILQPLEDKNGFVSLDKYIVTLKNNVIRTIKLNPVVIDNLSRLGLINLSDSEEIYQTILYKKGFECLKNNYKDIPKFMGTISYKSGILSITDFGIQFLDVCIDN